jgi:hypothetical protein
VTPFGYRLLLYSLALVGTIANAVAANRMHQRGRDDLALVFVVTWGLSLVFGVRRLSRTERR